MPVFVRLRKAEAVNEEDEKANGRHEQIVHVAHLFSLNKGRVARVLSYTQYAATYVRKFLF